MRCPVFLTFNFKKYAYLGKPLTHNITYLTILLFAEGKLNVVIIPQYLLSLRRIINCFSI